jgi:AraC-like DNA-binding protein
VAHRRLERSCKDWLRWRPEIGGVQRLQAWFSGAAYGRHRHDTYAIGLTDTGVQTFWYRGAVHRAVPGDVVVLHPDEVHDGYAGTQEGFGYRILYVDPGVVREVLRTISARPSALPFLDGAVSRSPRLRALVSAAFADEMPALRLDSFLLGLVEGLCAESASSAASPARRDEKALARAREVLESAHDRAVHSSELEAASGLSRFELARQFKAHFGMSPYRYSLMRRLGWARERLGKSPIARIAADAAFADQAHFTRAFKAAFGLTPGRYLALESGFR